MGPFRSLFSAWKYKKKGAALLSRAYRLVQGYRPSFLQSLINVTPFILREIYPAFLQVFILPLPNEPFTIKKKNAPYILVPVYFCISHVSSEKKTKKIVKEQAGVHATRMQNIRVLSLKNGVYIWTLVR